MDACIMCNELVEWGLGRSQLPIFFGCLFLKSNGGNIVCRINAVQHFGSLSDPPLFLCLIAPNNSSTREINEFRRSRSLWSHDQVMYDINIKYSHIHLKISFFNLKQRISTVSPEDKTIIVLEKMIGYVADLSFNSILKLVVLCQALIIILYRSR